MKLYRIFPRIDKYVYLKSDGLDRKTRKHLLTNKELQNKITFEFNIDLNEGEWPDLLSSGNGLFYVSEKLKEILQSELPLKDLEVIPTPLNDGTYSLILPKRCDVIDFENSELELYDSGAISEIIKLQVLTDRIPSKALFRLKEKYIHVFITSELKQILDINNLKGVQYLTATNLTEFEN